MSILRVQVSLTHESGLPEDVTVNTFHFESGPVFDHPNIRDMLEDFYAEPPAEGGNPLGNYLSTLLTGDGMVTIYNLDDAEPRVPVYEEPITFSTGSTALPSEVAFVTSWHAAPASGVAQARRRGRTFIGPLSTAALTNTSGRPASEFVTQVARISRDFIAAAEASINNTFVVYSPTLDAAAEVVGGWVDNAFDTQRRRGEAPTSRIITSATLPA